MFNNDPQTDSEDDTRSDEEKAKALGQEDDEATEARKKAFKSIKESFGAK